LKGKVKEEKNEKKKVVGSRKKRKDMKNLKREERL
jgi:hypothetical protein